MKYCFQYINAKQKVNISLNEMTRVMEDSTRCIVTGNDQHVERVGEYFCPFLNDGGNICGMKMYEFFTRMMCYELSELARLGIE
jgi:hypothetical protein